MTKTPPPTNMTQKSVKINIFFDISSKCHFSYWSNWFIVPLSLQQLFFCIHVREWGGRNERERIEHGRGMNEFLPMMLYWAEKHFYDDELGFIERETKLAYHHHHNVYIQLNFSSFFIHLVLSWNWMMMMRVKNYQQTCSRAVKKFMLIKT